MERSISPQPQLAGYESVKVSSPEVESSLLLFCRAMHRITNKRSFVLTRSSYPSLGHYGFHWTGDISSNWDDLSYSVPGGYSLSSWLVLDIRLRYAGYLAIVTVWFRPQPECYTTPDITTGYFTYLHDIKPAEGLSV